MIRNYNFNLNLEYLILSNLTKRRFLNKNREKNEKYVAIKNEIYVSPNFYVNIFIENINISL